MEKKVNVSVVIPAYNRLWCLPRAIESCRNTNCITEIIVVDDGSSDGTWEWLKTQSDVKAFYQENQGQTYAVNYGVSKAHGKYIRFLDSDDFLCEGFIDKQYEKAEETAADLVYSRVDQYDDESGIITAFPEMEPWTDFLEVQLSNRYGSHFLGMLFKTDWVKQVPRRPDFALREDRMFLLEYGLLSPKIEFVPGCAGYWVQHTSQMQGNYQGLISQATHWQYLNIFKKILDKLEKTGRLTTHYKKAACTALWPLCQWIGVENIKEAGRLYDWIMELDPDFKIPENGMKGLLYKTLGVNATHKIIKAKHFLK